MGFFDLVEQQDAVGGLTDGIGEQSAIFIAHVSCRRSDQFGDGMLLGVLAHIEA